MIGKDINKIAGIIKIKMKEESKNKEKKSLSKNSERLKWKPHKI